jgi:predicted phage-related endonuclease
MDKDNSPNIKNDLLDHQAQSFVTGNEEQEFIASNMTEEEKEILEQLRRDRDLRDQIPEEERIPISHPDKYSISD